MISKCLFLVFFLYACIPLGWSDVFSFSLDDLRQGRLVQLKKFKGSNLILAFFRPRCSSCKKQLLELNILKKASKFPIEILAVGIAGTSEELKQELQGIKLEFPVLETSDSFSKEIGNIELTPSTWIFNASPGKGIKKFQGFKKVSDLIQAFEIK